MFVNGFGTGGPGVVDASTEVVDAFAFGEFGGKRKEKFDETLLDDFLWSQLGVLLGYGNNYFCQFGCTFTCAYLGYVGGEGLLIYIEC